MILSIFLSTHSDLELIDDLLILAPKQLALEALRYTIDSKLLFTIVPDTANKSSALDN